VNTETAHALIAEIAPHVVGATVAGVLNPSPDCLVLDLRGDGSRYLGAVAMKALPIVFLTDAVPDDADRGPATPYAGSLGGSRIESFDPVARRPAAVLRLTWTDPTGRDVERVITVSLGRSPGIGFGERETARVGGGGRENRDASRGPDLAGSDSSRGPGMTASDAPTEPPRPRVTWWHDASGRLHARLSDDVQDGARGESRTFGSLNEAAAFMFTEFWPGLDLERRREKLAAAVERGLRRIETAMEKVRAEIEDARGAEEYRKKGQLLLARQDAVTKGATSVTIPDYDGSSEVVIEIDPRLTPRRNAEALFRKAKKAERRAEKAPVRLGELEEKEGALRADAEAVARATAGDMTELEERLLPRRQAPPTRREAAERARFRTYRISGGWEVLVGKSNRDNDILTHKIAKPSDLWFHARQVAGSHVVLRKSGSKAQPDRQAILEAAAIAAFHSKAGKSSKVSVCYTEKRHVRKARGGPPGLAVVARENVVMVSPKIPDD
jgi:hypothetical protein